MAARSHELYSGTPSIRNNVQLCPERGREHRTQASRTVELRRLPVFGRSIWLVTTFTPQLSEIKTLQAKSGYPTRVKSQQNTDSVKTFRSATFPMPPVLHLCSLFFWRVPATQPWRWSAKHLHVLFQAKPNVQQRRRVCSFMLVTFDSCPHCSNRWEHMFNQCPQAEGAVEVTCSLNRLQVHLSWWDHALARTHTQSLVRWWKEGGRLVWWARSSHRPLGLGVNGVWLLSRPCIYTLPHPAMDYGQSYGPRGPTASRSETMRHTSSTRISCAETRALIRTSEQCTACFLAPDWIQQPVATANVRGRARRSTKHWPQNRAKINKEVYVVCTDIMPVATVVAQGKLLSLGKNK